VLAMKAYGGVDVQCHSFLISALHRGEWLDSCHGLFTLGEISPPPPAPIKREAGWASEAVCTLWR